MHYSAQHISKIISGKLSGIGDVNSSIEHLLIDSRKIVYAPSSLFFAIKSERNNGHNYISGLYERGVRNFVVSEPVNIKKYPDAVFIFVDDALVALQLLGKHHRSQFKIPVIGITGSNGKTIVKEWLCQLMQDDKNIVRSPKSYNSQVGVPLSVWQMNESHDLGIFEAGISQPGEMEKLETIIQPSIGLFTNIGQPHSENFKNVEEKIREKIKLFTHTQTLIYCCDQPSVQKAAKDLQGIKLFSWSRKESADLQVLSVKKENHQTTIEALFKKNKLVITILFTDDASIENAIHCWACMLYLGSENNVIAGRMKHLAPVAMRLELKEGVNNCSVINDSYNSDLGSLSIALDFLNQQQQHPKRTVILSDILQSGQPEELLYKEVATLLATKGVHRLVGIGEAITRQSKQFDLEKTFYADTKEFLSGYHNGQFYNETILLKGARVFGFEAISKVLQQKAHETVLEIDLNALIHNLNYYRSLTSPGTKVMAMVKAFSYGSGSFEIANVLQFHRVDYLAVAYADEGIELRKAGIELPVMVMNPEEQGYDAMLQYQLEPELFSLRVWDLFSSAAKEYKSKEPIAIHIKLDTGMHRLGFGVNEMEELLKRIRSDKYLRVQSVFSHLAASDESEHDDFTKQQLQFFHKMSDEILKACDYPVLRHIANSAAISRFPEAQLDMVRLGIGLYGIGANMQEQQRLQNVSSLKTSISQIKNIPAGESIGYSRKGFAKENLKIATVPVGYADGLSRKLSNGKGKMFINGKPAPVIGNVCMDMCMLDITGIEAAEGDEVIIFGEVQPIAEIAKAMESIPYEVLTNVSRRVKRVYYQE